MTIDQINQTPDVLETPEILASNISPDILKTTEEKGRMANTMQPDYVSSVIDNYTEDKQHNIMAHINDYPNNPFGDNEKTLKEQVENLITLQNSYKKTNNRETQEIMQDQLNYLIKLLAETPYNKKGIEDDLYNNPDEDKNHDRLTQNY